MQDIPRREFITKGVRRLRDWRPSMPPDSAYAFPGQPGEEVVRWLDQPAPNPVPQVIKNQLVWEDLNSWITPNDKFFSIAHFNRPVIDASTWKLEIDGLVKNPMTLTLADIKARPRQEVTFTIECSGNHGLPFFNGGIGNARWAGTPLAPILKEAGVLENGIEVVFWGTDEGEITLHDDIRDVKFKQNFARSMSLADAMDPKNILCYEMNGAPLPPRQRLPAPADSAGLVRHRQREMAEAHRGARSALREPSHGAELRHPPRGRPQRRDRVGGNIGGTGAARVGTRPGHPHRQRLSDRRSRLGRADRPGRGEDRRWAVDAGDHRPQRGSGVRLEDLVPRLAESVCRRAHRHLAGDRYERQRPAGDERSLDRQEAHLLGKQRAGDPPHSHRLTNLCRRRFLPAQKLIWLLPFYSFATLLAAVVVLALCRY